jgi:hypothetical protein
MVFLRQTSSWCFYAKHLHGVFTPNIFMVFLRHFQQYFSFIVAISFIGGGNRRKPHNYIKLHRIHLAMSGVRIHSVGGYMH